MVVVVVVGISGKVDEESGMMKVVVVVVMVPHCLRVF